MSDKIHAHTFTSQILAQDVDNPNHVAVNRAANDFANIKDKQVHIVSGCFAICKASKGDEMLVLETSEYDGGLPYGFITTEKKPKIDDLADGDVRLWNPNANIDDNINTAYIDIKADGTLKIHKKDGKITVKDDGAVLIEQGADVSVLIKNDSVNAKVGITEMNLSADAASIKTGLMVANLNTQGVSIKTGAAGGQLLLNPLGKVAIGKTGTELIDLVAQILTILVNGVQPVAIRAPLNNILTQVNQLKTTLT